MKDIQEYSETLFESIKHTDEYGYEYWLARELQNALEYKKWQKFINVIENAKTACKQSDFIVDVLPKWVKHQKCLMEELKTLVSFIMLVIKDYIMVKQQMILQKERV